MINLKERIKALRKTLGLTQQEFADRVGLKRNSLANYETGRNTPMDAVMKSICREFNVNEDWLRTGEGEMFIKLTRDEEMAKLTKQLLNEEEDSFKNRLISVLANLTDQQWEVLAEVAEKLSNEKAND